MTTRDRIIQAALTLIAERGLTSVTMVAVAEEAGVARATLYNNYPDIPSILADAAAAHNEEAIAGLRQALAVVNTPVERLGQLVRHLAALATHGHALAHQEGLPPQWRERVGAFDRELDAQISAIVDGGVASGDFRADLDVAAVTVVVRHSLAGMSEMIAHAPDRAADVTGQTTAFLRAALAAPPGKSSES